MFEVIDEQIFEVGSSFEMVRIFRHQLIADALGISVDTRDLRCEFVEIPPGSGLIGASVDHVSAWHPWRNEARTFFGDHETPQTAVEISRPFLLARVPATQSLWDALQSRGIDAWDQRNIQSDWLPVTGVSWTSLAPVLIALKCRLPSEAEWEYACRAGATTTFFHGDLEFELGEYAWYKSGGPGTVDARKPNAFGLHDMLGNVWEWCADPWHESHEGHHGAQAPRDADGAVERVLRGGSFQARSPPLVSCAIRTYAGAMSHAEDVGVRLAAWLTDS